MSHSGDTDQETDPCHITKTRLNALNKKTNNKNKKIINYDKKSNKKANDEKKEKKNCKKQKPNLLNVTVELEAVPIDMTTEKEILTTVERLISQKLMSDSLTDKGREDLLSDLCAMTDAEKEEWLGKLLCIETNKFAPFETELRKQNTVASEIYTTKDKDGAKKVEHTGDTKQLGIGLVGNCEFELCGICQKEDSRDKMVLRESCQGKIDLSNISKLYEVLCINYININVY